MKKPISILLFAAACSGPVDDAAPGIQQGTIEARWTIEETSDPAKCSEHGAATLQLTIADAGGIVREAITAPCTDFQARADVRAGIYAVSAAFRDAAGQATSATVRVDPASVEGNATTIVPLVFTAELMDIGKARQAIAEPRP